VLEAGKVFLCRTCITEYPDSEFKQRTISSVTRKREPKCDLETTFSVSLSSRCTISATGEVSARDVTQPIYNSAFAVCLPAVGLCILSSSCCNDVTFEDTTCLLHNLLKEQYGLRSGERGDQISARCYPFTFFENMPAVKSKFVVKSCK
jgi:hypothetical protein